MDHPIRDEVNRGPKPTSPSTSLTSDFTGRLAVPTPAHSGPAVGDPHPFRSTRPAPRRLADGQVEPSMAPACSGSCAGEEPSGAVDVFEVAVFEEVRDGFSRATSAPAATFPTVLGTKSYMPRAVTTGRGPWLHCCRPPPKQPSLPDDKLWRRNLPSTAT